MKPFPSRCVDQKMIVTLIAMIAVGAGCRTQIDPESTPKFVVHVEEPVTHILSPLTPEGAIDYLEAANRRHSQGVTANNNWEVVVRESFGPIKELDEPSQRQYYQRLGIPPQAENPNPGEYFQSPRLGGEGVSELEEKLAHQLYDTNTPWRTEDFSELAAWLDRQSQHLDRWVTGSQLPRYYAPRVMSEAAHVAKVREMRSWFDGLQKSSDKTERLVGRLTSNLFGGLDEHPAPLSRFHVTESVQQSREVARVLRIRALLRIGEGDFAGACSDILAIHRISRLVSQGMLDEWLVGSALEEMGCFLHGELLKSGKLTDELAREQLDELNRLPRRRSGIDLTDLGDRHVALDAMQYAPSRRREIVELFNSGQSGIDGRTVRALLALDWNMAMRKLNEKFDRYVQALRQSDGLQRLDAMEEFGPRTKAKKDEVVLEEMKEAAKAGTEVLTQFMVQLYFDKYAHILPKIELRPTARRDVVRTAYAAYLFRSREGAYPTSVNELATILGASIVDAYTDEPLVLKPVEDGIVVYSVGENLIDDGGLTYDQGKDDLLVRLTAARSEPADSCGGCSGACNSQ